MLYSIGMPNGKYALLKESPASYNYAAQSLLWRAVILQTNAGYLVNIAVRTLWGAFTEYLVLNT